GAFAADKAQHFKEQTIKQVVYDQIYHPAPAGAMPPKLVTGADATSVAAYVAAVAGTGSASNGAPPTLAGPPARRGGAGGGSRRWRRSGRAGRQALRGSGLLELPHADGRQGHRADLQGAIRLDSSALDRPVRQGRRRLLARVDPGSRQADREGLPEGHHERKHPAGVGLGGEGEGPGGV